MKKILALLLFSACFMTCAAVPLAAETGVSYPNILRNSDFETLENGFPKNWLASHSDYVELDTTMPQHDGTSGNTIKITWPKDAAVKSPYVIQTCRTENENKSNPPYDGEIRLKPKIRYEIGLWVRADWEGDKVKSSDLRFEMEVWVGPYDGRNTPNGSLVTETHVFTGGVLPSTKNKWEYKTVEFKVPEKAVVMPFECRLYTEGITVWVDEITLKQAEPERIMDFRPDQFFYYPEAETGYAKVKMYEGFYKEQSVGGSVDFALLRPDGTSIKSANCPLTADGEATFSYPLDELKTQQKTAFTIRATAKDSNGDPILGRDGKAIPPYDKEIYVYPRPTRMRKDGMLYDTYHEGKIYIPNAVCSTNTDGTLHVQELKAAGFNLLHLSSGASTQYLKDMLAQEAACQDGTCEKPDHSKCLEDRKPKTLLGRWLDQLAAAQMRAVVALCSGKDPAAGPTNEAMTRRIVTDFKEHPAIGAWGIMDEPHYNLSDPEYMMVQSYKLVRDLDDINPTHIIEIPNSVEMTSAYCDFPGVDPYPGGTVPDSGPYWETYPNCNVSPATFSDEATAKLRQTAERYKKPFTTYNQAFAYYGYTPSLGDMRSFYYQNLLGDAVGTGWYAYTEKSYDRSIRQLPHEEYEIYFTEFHAEEQMLAQNLFGRESEYPVFNQYADNRFQYKSVLANDDIYFVVLNRKTETQTIEIPLKSMNGLVTACGKPEELYAIGESVRPEVVGGALRVTLPPAQVSLIRITCSGVQESDLAEASFEDLSGTNAEMIESLYRSGILEGTADRTFSPNTAITRGQFIRGLMRALDLADYISPKDPVLQDQNASYYRELQVARKMGILTEDYSRPNDSLTKGEALSLCERALRKGLRLGETAFSYENFAEQSTATVTRAEAAALLYSLWK